MLIMNDKELRELSEKIKEAVKISGQKLREQKRAQGQKVVVSENGKIKYIDP